MILDRDGREWGTAAQIAAAVGATPAAVRRWADPRRPGPTLTSASMLDDDGRRQVRYPLDEATSIDRAKRLGGRGRRRLDTTAALV